MPCTRAALKFTLCFNFLPELERVIASVRYAGLRSIEIMHFSTENSMSERVRDADIHNNRMRSRKNMTYGDVATGQLQ